MCNTLCQQHGHLSETTLRYINPIYHPRSPQIPHKHPQPSLPSLPVQPSGIVARRTWGKQLKKTRRTPGKEPILFYTRLVLDFMRPLVNHWSPHTHLSHCMTSIRPVAAAWTRARVSPAMHAKVKKMVYSHRGDQGLIPMSAIYEL